MFMISEEGRLIIVTEGLRLMAKPPDHILQWLLRWEKGVV